MADNIVNRVAKDIHMLITDANLLKKILGDPATMFDSSKKGLYEHEGVYMVYVGSRESVDYFEKFEVPQGCVLMINDLKGVTIND